MFASAYSPSHITGIFEVAEDSQDPLRIGSRGAGFCLEAGVNTIVFCEASSENFVTIKINGLSVEDAQVSREVVNLLLPLAGKDYHISVEHKVEVPIGCGFGSSGAGALSLALALNSALNTGLSDFEAAQKAHLAEVKCRTGLGTVAAEAFGGAEVRLSPGGPGVAEIVPIPVNPDHVGVATTLGRISTPHVLSNVEAKRRVNSVSGSLLKELISRPSIEEFLLISRKFTHDLGLTSKRLLKIIAAAGSKGYVCGMAMLGETVFTIVRENEVNEVQRIFENLTSAGMVLVSPLSPKGARLL